VLSTTVGGVWVLQALLGVESMPAALRLKPFIPSAHGEGIVETDQGLRPLNQTGEYLALVQAGVIDAAGAVDEMVRDWMTVLGRAERQVVLTVRHPVPAGADDDTDDDGAALRPAGRTRVICRHRRWLAMAARDGDAMVIAPVGESDDPAEQAELMCRTLIPALGEAVPADIEGVNVPADEVTATLQAAAPYGRQGATNALARLGLPPATVAAVIAAHDDTASAMAVVSVLDRVGTDRRLTPHPRVLSVADTELGRLSFSTTTGADGRGWMSIWPATAEALHDDLAGLLAAPAPAEA
jgi:hypothetical protein